MDHRTGLTLAFLQLPVPLLKLPMKPISMDRLLAPVPFERADLAVVGSRMWTRAVKVYHVDKEFEAV